MQFMYGVEGKITKWDSMYFEFEFFRLLDQCLQKRRI